MEDMCCTMIDSNHCHRFACSIMLQLGSRAPIVIKWPAVVLVIWPHFNGNAQRRPRIASLGLALFSSRLCCFLCTNHGYPRGKSNRPRGCPKIPGQIPCFLVGCHWRFCGLLACLWMHPWMAKCSLVIQTWMAIQDGEFPYSGTPRHPSVWRFVSQVRRAIQVFGVSFGIKIPGEMLTFSM